MVWESRILEEMFDLLSLRSCGYKKRIAHMKNKNFNPSFTLPYTKMKIKGD